MSQTRIPFRHIAVEGPIGVGKTSLVQLLGRRFEGVMILEDVTNPFLPSFYEGLPLVLVEARACGCRLVATDLPGIRERLLPVLGDELALVELPRLTGVDKPVAADLPAFIRADFEFHLAIADAGHNELLAQFYHLTRTLFKKVSYELISLPAVQEESIAIQAAVLMAIEARDPREARQAAEAHMQYIYRLLEQ